MMEKAESSTASGEGTASREPRAGRREWIGLAVIALPCLLYSMDLTVLNLAVPALSAELHPGAAQLLWIVDIYGFLIAGSLITMGTLGDRIGRRRLLLIGAAAFGVASILAYFSRTAGMLIASRALLGVSGATFAPSTLSLIRNMFLDSRERTTAISIWIMSYSVGGAIGPVLGGLVLQRFRWNAVFLLAVPVMALLLGLGSRFLPEYRDPEAGRLDLRSAALSLAAVLAVIYGLKKIAEHGPGAIAFGCIAAGLVAGVSFWRRQTSLKDPLIDVRLFRAPAFRASLLTYMFSCFTAFGVYIFISQYLQLVLGLSPFQSGLWTLPWSAGFVIGSSLTPAIVRRFPPASVMAAGLAVAAVGFLLLARADSASGLASIVAGSIVFSLGLAPVITLANDIVLGSAPPERAGAAAGISETTAELGGALGIAILGSVGTIVYRGAMRDALLTGLSPEAVEAARGTLGGAAEVARHLPDTIGAALIASSREAFTRAFRWTSYINAGLTAALAVIAALVMRPSGQGRPSGAKADLRAADASA